MSHFAGFLCVEKSFSIIITPLAGLKINVIIGITKITVQTKEIPAYEGMIRYECNFYITKLLNFSISFTS